MEKKREGDEESGIFVDSDLELGEKKRFSRSPFGIEPNGERKSQRRLACHVSEYIRVDIVPEYRLHLILCIDRALSKIYYFSYKRFLKQLRVKKLEFYRKVKAHTRIYFHLFQCDTKTFRNFFFTYFKTSQHELSVLFSLSVLVLIFFCYFFNLNKCDIPLSYQRPAKPLPAGLTENMRQNRLWVHLVNRVRSLANFIGSETIKSLTIRDILRHKESHVILSSGFKFLIYSPNSQQYRSIL